MKKKRRLKKGVILILLSSILLGLAGYFFYQHQKQEKMQRAYRRAYQSLTMQVDESQLVLEYGQDYDLSTFVQSYHGELKQEGMIDTSIVSSPLVRYTLQMYDAYDRQVERNYIYQFKVKDTQAPTIKLKEKEIELNYGESYDVKENVVAVKDIVDGDLEYQEKSANGAYTIVSNLDVNQAGEYVISVIAKDKHGMSAKESFLIKVKSEEESMPLPVADNPQAFPYYIKVNRALNTVTVYSVDENNKYSKPFKAFVCSTGAEVGATPLGVYQTSDQFRWGALNGGVWGQYCTRITGPILFHSVPYFSQNAGDLEYEEYNKLGNAASLGCVRLCVRDVKWIYENCPKGTTVEIYDDYSSPGPLGKPEPITIDINSPNKGWDPTDPDENNPW